MSLLLIISAQGLLLLLIVSILFQLPRPLPFSAYIACLVLAIGGVSIALLLDNQSVALFDTAELLTIITALIVLVVGVGYGIGEIRKTRPVWKIRPLWLSITGLLLIIITLAIPITMARSDLQGRLSETENVQAMPIATPTSRETARQILDDVALVVAEQTGLSAEDVTVLLDDGASVASLLAQHGGDIEIVIERVTQIMSAGVETMTRNGQMSEDAAAVALPSMPIIVRLGMNTSLSGMLARFETEPESTPAP